MPFRFVNHSPKTQNRPLSWSPVLEPSPVLQNRPLSCVSCVILLVLGILGAVFCITKGTKRLPFILGAVMGLFGLYEYFMQPLYVLTPLGMPLLALCGVIAAVSIAGVVLTYVNKKN